MLTSHEVCRRAGCSYRQLDYLDRQGVTAPLRPAGGNGTRRGWGRWQVATVALLTELGALGANHAVLRVVAQRTESLDADQWAGTVFIDMHGRIDQHRTDKPCWSVNLDRYARIADLGQAELLGV